MQCPFVFWTHPLTGKPALYIGKDAMAYRTGRYIVPVPRRYPFDC
jgi:hypothetical protein